MCGGIVGVRSASEIPTYKERDVEFLVQYKSLKGKWKALFRTKDSMEALQVMEDAHRQNPTREYRTLSQEVFAKGKKPVEQIENSRTAETGTELANQSLPTQGDT